GFERRLRQRAGREAQACAAEPAADLLRTLAELERPDRVARRDVNRSVARDPRRPREARDLRAHGPGPAFYELGHPGLRAEALQLRADAVSEPFQAPPPRAATAPRAAPTHASR